MNRSYWKNSIYMPMQKMKSSAGRSLMEEVLELFLLDVEANKTKLDFAIKVAIAHTTQLVQSAGLTVNQDTKTMVQLATRVCSAGTSSTHTVEVPEQSRPNVMVEKRMMQDYATRSVSQASMELDQSVGRVAHKLHPLIVEQHVVVLRKYVSNQSSIWSKLFLKQLRTSLN